MRTAIITGISGQDAFYLSEQLLGVGYAVVGLSRDPSRAKGRVNPSIQLKGWDMRNDDWLRSIISDTRPNEIYNFAACSSGSGMFDNVVEIGEINGLSVSRLLEAIRIVDPKIRFFQASSSEMFGVPTDSPQSESTPFQPRSPYGAAKLYAHWLVQIYRKKYNLFACSGIFFNHESPRRGDDFVTRKVSMAVAEIQSGRRTFLSLGNLAARRDWGFSDDYVRGARLTLAAPAPDDYVFATGCTHSVRELCETAFGRVGLDYRAFVREGGPAHRPDEPIQLVGNAAKARSKLGWSPRIGFQELVHLMVDADVAAERR